MMFNPSEANRCLPAASLPEVLYATSHYQVRLRSVMPGDILAFEPVDSVTQYECLLVKGVLRRALPKEASAPELVEAVSQKSSLTSFLKPGTRLNGLAPMVDELCNTSDAPVLCLEILWGKGFTPLPLEEVTETRPWGSFTVLKDEPDYKLKQLTVNPDKRLSLQRHQKREEHWIVTAGTPEVTLDDTRVTLNVGDYIHIPLHSWHRLANLPVASATTSADLVEIIELQLGEYFGEDDIERREDDFGRR